MNSAVNPNLAKIIKDLIRFSEEILLDTSEQQWKNCEKYVKQCSCLLEGSYIISEDREGGGTFRTLCSHTICSMMLQKQDQFTRGSMKLQTLLINTVSFIYLKPHFSPVMDYLKNIVVTGSLESNENVRALTALLGRSQFMKMLVNLDLVSSVWASSSVLMECIHEEFHHFISLHREPVLDSMLIKILTSAEKALKTFFCKYPGNWRRIYLAIICIRAIQFKLKKKENMAEEYIYCLKMYFAATRDPLLTINEVRIILYACFNPLNKLDFFESYCEEFPKLMPECPANFEPRNLTDLVRFKIRQNLKKCTLPLPAAVEKLSLPRHLKSFVLGDVISVSRKSGNVSLEKIVTTSELNI